MACVENIRLTCPIPAWWACAGEVKEVEKDVLSKDGDGSFWEMHIVGDIKFCLDPWTMAAATRILESLRS